MSNGGLFDAHQRPDAEVAILIRAEVQGLWDRTVAHIKAAMEVLHKHLQVERGPDPDYDPSIQVMRELKEAIIRLRHPGPHNGDSNEPGKQWPTVLSAVGIMITLLVVGAGIVSYISSLNTKVDSVREAQTVEARERATQRAETLELIRQANDRINRLEDRDRRTGYQPGS